MKRSFIIAVFIVVLGIVGIWYVGRGTSKQSNQPETTTLRVTASFYPLYFFAKEIGGEKARVVNITPAGAEPHDYELSTQNRAAIEKSDLLIINGQLEPLENKIREELQGKKTAIAIAADGLITQNDAHVWLDPVLAEKEVEAIARAFERIDPANTTYYQKNARRLNEALISLHQAFVQGLAHCEQKDIVTSHAAFGYIAHRYNLTQVSIAGLSPDSEPSPKKLTEIAQFAKTNDVKYIFFETLVSPRLAQTIADEVGAQTIVFNPLEGLTRQEESNGQDYLSIQKENLDNLKIALQCK